MTAPLNLRRIIRILAPENSDFRLAIVGDHCILSTESSELKLYTGRLNFEPVTFKELTSLTSLPTLPTQWGLNLIEAKTPKLVVTRGHYQIVYNPRNQHLKYGVPEDSATIDYSCLICNPTDRSGWHSLDPYRIQIRDNQIEVEVSGEPTWTLTTRNRIQYVVLSRHRLLAVWRGPEYHADIWDLDSGKFVDSITPVKQILGQTQCQFWINPDSSFWVLCSAPAPTGSHLLYYA